MKKEKLEDIMTDEEELLELPEDEDLDEEDFQEESDLIDDTEWDGEDNLVEEASKVSLSIDDVFGTEEEPKLPKKEWYERDDDSFDLNNEEEESELSEDDLMMENTFESVSDDDESLLDEEKMNVEDLLKKEPNNNNKKIIIIVIAVLLVAIITIILVVVSGKNKDTKPSKVIFNTNVSNQESDEKYKYPEVMSLYGKKSKEEIKNYYDLNEMLPSTFPEVTLEDYSVVCEIKEMYTPELIFLGNCSIDGSEPIYSYGTPLNANLNPSTNSNSNSNDSSNTNEGTNSNKPTNANSNKTSNVNSNKPSNLNTNSNKPSTSNSNVNTPAETVTSGAVSNSGNKSQHTDTKFGSFQKVVDIVKEESTTYRCTYEDCYSGNDGKIAYAADGSMVFNEKNPIVSYNLPASSKIADQYSINLTVKGDTFNQIDQYGGAILGISKTDANYLAWIGYREGNLIVYSFVGGNTGSEVGIATIPFSDYSNKIVNIQIVAQRNKNTVVYVNGESLKTFNSGTEQLSFGPVTLGDLRPGRGLKFSGNIYEVVVYDRLLSLAEVKTNYEAAKTKYNIK